MTEEQRQRWQGTNAKMAEEQMQKMNKGNDKGRINTKMVEEQSR